MGTAADSLQCGAMAHPAKVFPASLLLTDKACLVVGAGRIAARKIAALLDAGADVTIIAPRISPEVSALGVRTEQRPYRPGEADGYWLVVTATGDPEVDGQVFTDANAARVFVNSADDPEHCSFHLPAVARRGAVSVAVATGGGAPGLAVWLRDRIAENFGPELAELAERVGAVRAELRREAVATEGLDWSGLITSLLAALGEDAGAPDRVAERFIAAARDARGPR